MVNISGAIMGGWFPDAWDVPVAIGLGVVLTGYMGDTIAGFVSQFVPAEWLNPVTEIVAGILLFLLGGFVGGDWSMWIRLFSMGAFAVGIADAITILLGLGGAAAGMQMGQSAVVVNRSASNKAANVQTRYQ